jgi:hypothetical protein
MASVDDHTVIINKKKKRRSVTFLASRSTFDKDIMSTTTAPAAVAIEFGSIRFPF